VKLDKGEFWCIDETKGVNTIFKMPADEYELNNTIYELMYMHLACFILIFAADMYYSNQLNTNVVAA